ncbi:MAG TPA: nucleotidyltransferase domain-containing protein [Ignavibacteria bacterium]|nr:nucleotidyltransferase domain-containing protein [Ignavibacteria bacterium]
MKTEIENELYRLEREHIIKILYAVESGSRGWEFASTDSDWDVRFIYIHQPEWYLSIEQKKDTIEEILPTEIDLSGWELKKALLLFRKSNPPLLEWLRSPIIYKEQYSTAERLRKLADESFNTKSCLNYYLHMAEGNFNEYLKKDYVKLKKYFYVMRAILVCEWIESTNTIAPMEFPKLIESFIKDPNIKNEIIKLLERKTSGEELDVSPKILILNDFLEEKIKHFKDYIKTLDKIPLPEFSLLNEVFVNTLNEVWGFDYTSDAKIQD